LSINPSHNRDNREDDGNETVSMLITQEDVAVFFEKCGDDSLSTRKQVRFIVRVRVSG
jgi:hypothetical protein